MPGSIMMQAFAFMQKGWLELKSGFSAMYELHCYECHTVKKNLLKQNILLPLPSPKIKKGFLICLS